MVYVSAWLNDRIEVNPRYGSGVDVSTGQVAVVRARGAGDDGDDRPHRRGLGRSRPGRNRQTTP